MNVEIKPLESSDKDWVLTIIRHWGADFVVTRGRKVYPAEIEGFYAVNETGERVGLVTFEIVNDQCEIVTLDAFVQWSGIGTQLIEQVRTTARKRGCKRLWLITTNDNIPAIRFYQRRDFELVAIHRNALDLSRALKPSIPLVGMHGIPIRDELEFEQKL